MDSLHWACGEGILLGRWLGMLRVDFPSETVNTRVAMIVHVPRHAVPIVFGHDACEGASGAWVTQAFMKEMQTHAMKWFG